MLEMKITDVYSHVELTGAKRAASVSKQDKPGAKKDEVALSNQAKDYQAVSKILADLPDIRQDVVDGVMAKYDAGINVSGQDIAAKILGNYYR
jgi:negative regulator of flagellin synthesis FlgM